MFPHRYMWQALRNAVDHFLETGDDQGIRSLTTRPGYARRAAAEECTPALEQVSCIDGDSRLLVMSARNATRSAAELLPRVVPVWEEDGGGVVCAVPERDHCRSRDRAPSMSSMKRFMDATRMLRENELLRDRLRRAQERRPGDKCVLGRISACNASISSLAARFQAADEDVFSSSARRSDKRLVSFMESELRRGIPVVHEAVVCARMGGINAPCRGRKVVEVAPHWLVCRSTVSASGAAHVFQFLKSRFADHHWEAVSRRCVPGKIVIGQMGSANRLQNLPFALHAKIKICMCLSRKHQMRDTLALLGVPPLYADCVCALPLRVLRAQV